MKLALIVVLSTIAFASALTHFEEPQLSGGWKNMLLGAEHKALRTVQLIFQVRENNLDELQRQALEVSDPKNPRYGQHLSQQEVDTLTAPSKSHVSRVENWVKLFAAENTVQVRRGRTVIVESPVDIAQDMLRTTFRYVKHSETGQTALRASRFSLPNAIAEVVSAVFGPHGLPLPTVNRTRTTKVGSNVASVTPSVIAKAYGVSGVTASGSTSYRQAVAEFQGQTMEPSDLTTFFQKFVPNAGPGDDKVYKFVGNTGTGRAGVEASLDIQYIMGVAPGVKTEFWYYGGNNFCSDLKDWTSALLSSSSPPVVNSVSYGWQGTLSSIGCNTAQVAAVDSDFASLAARGVTVIFASGDGGSGLPAWGSGSTLYPSWPASSPWVTAVGATRFLNQNSNDGEQAVDQFGSGGGFSSMFQRNSNASYQESVVNRYLSGAQGGPSPPFPAPGDYSPNGRATPDVAALGEGFQVYASGQLQGVGGTSAAAPTFAGLVSLLNEARLKNGRSTLGFLNPFLYANQDALTDITVGNDRTSRYGTTLKYGYECVQGWDPVTGLGTPKFQKLLAAVGGN